MFFNILDVTCGTVDVPQTLANLIKTIYTIIKIAIPLILILMGMLDLGKAVMSQKEDEIKKQQGMFVKRLISAALVFFVLAIVQLLIGIVAADDSETIGSCIKGLIGSGW